MQRKVKTKRVFGGLILMYHRITELKSDPFSLAVTPANFKEHLDILRKYYLPISLDEIVAIIKSGRTPKNMVAITFDDGYSDVLENAKPLLEACEIPATAFIVTGQIGRKREFMWDELERLLLQPGVLPEKLHLSISDQILQWELAEWANYTEATYLKNLGWRFEDEKLPSFRHTIFRELYFHLKHANEGERLRVLDEILAWTGGNGQVRETHRVLTQDEVHYLSKDFLINVGAHSVSHSVLAGLTRKLQLKEVQKSKSYLEEVVGYKVKNFAYPYGGNNDYTAETISVLQETDYSCSCSTLDGFVSVESDLFQLPRLDVKNWDGDQFAKHLTKALGS